MSPLQFFFQENSFTFGEKGAPEIRPGNVLTVLNLGLKNYYETYQADMRRGETGYIVKINENTANEESRLFIHSCSHEFLGRYYSAIGFVQLFMELYIVDFLDEISTVITRSGIKDHCFISELCQSGITDELKNNQTISFSRILKRLRRLFKEEGSLPAKFRIPKRYSFLNFHLDTLSILNDYRNGIMHSGKQVLNHYAFDLLFVNHVFPIVKEIIRIEDDTTPLNRNLHCGLNVIEELNKLHLPREVKSDKKHQNLNELINQVYHLKELGRASLGNPLFMGEFGDKQMQENLKAHNDKKRQVAEIEANVTHEPLKYHERFVCPSCGTKTLMTFDIWTETEGTIKRPYRAKCLLCSYSIHYSIGEPKDYGIMTEYIFNRLGEN